MKFNPMIEVGTSAFQGSSHLSDLNLYLTRTKVVHKSRL